MSIFSSIMSKIFPASHPAVAASPAGAAASTPSTAALDASGPTANATTTTTPNAANAPAVDVEGILNGLSSKSQQTLNWRSSIVDLMKLLGLDSGLEARKGLAHELHYSGDMGDSASMNIWLHKQVMTKLAENGGKVPEELKN